METSQCVLRSEGARRKCSKRRSGGKEHHREFWLPSRPAALRATLLQYVTMCCHLLREPKCLSESDKRLCVWTCKVLAEGSRTHVVSLRLLRKHRRLGTQFYVLASVAEQLHSAPNPILWVMFRALQDPLHPSVMEGHRDFRTKDFVWSRPPTDYRASNWYIEAWIFIAVVIVASACQVLCHDHGGRHGPRRCSGASGCQCRCSRWCLQLRWWWGWSSSL